MPPPPPPSPRPEPGPTRRAGGIPVAAGPGPWPLSPAQQRLWYLHQLRPAGTDHTITLPLRLVGELDTAALAAAVTRVVARHEPLRTTYAATPAGAVQRVHPPRDVPVPLADLSTLPPPERRAELDRRVAAAADQPFDLAAGPVFRASLVRLAPTEHVLLVVVHHIAFDGWSAGVLTGELSAGYLAAVRGGAADLPPLPVRYRDVAAWQQRRLADGSLDPALAHWRRRLAGATPLRLPTDRPRSAAGPGAAAGLDFVVPAAATGALKDLGRRHRASLFMVLAAATQALLSWYSGSDDITVGTVVTGRERAETEPLIGLFVNTVVLRTRVDDDEPFGALLDRVRDVVLDALGAAEVPFDEVVTRLRPERDGTRVPLAPVLVVLQNAPAPVLTLPGLRVADLAGVEPAGSVTGFDLQVQFQERSGELAGVLTYDRGLFDPPTAARLARHLAALLIRVATGPDRPLWRLWPADVAGPARTAAAGGPEPTLPDLVAAQVRAHPDRPAVRAAGRTVTYRELADRADRMVAALAGRGVRRGDRVVTVLPPGVDAVTAVLALARMGVAGVGLDPDTPPERLRAILRDSAPALVLTGADPLPDPGGTPVAQVPDVLGAPAPAPAPPGPRPADPLCVVYTSGSTGHPKGVVIPHSAVANLLSWDRAAFGAVPQERVGQVASLSFDASVWEIWSALTRGACLSVADRSLRQDPRALAGWIAAEGLARCFLTTTIAAQLLAGGAPAGADRLRHLLVGGERLAAAPAGLPFALVNVYGPTEATVFATCFDTTGWRSPGPPPIGRPLPGVTARVLDRHLRPVPPGRVAELYLGGRGVAQGYAGQPGLTAERFVADPAGPPGARMYRTGDLVSATAAGLLEFHGRADRQVKVRGTRVELDEVQHVLERHERVARAAVLSVPGRADEPTVVAYLTAAGPPVDLAELRGWLRARLPEAMVPARVVELAALPLTPTGKVDLRALAARAVPADAGPEAAAAPPRTDSERAVHQLWADVLGRDAVGVHENFFDVGGSSISLLDLRTRLEPRYGAELPVALLLGHPTIAAMARLLDQRADAAGGPEGDYEL